MLWYKIFGVLFFWSVLGALFALMVYVECFINDPRFDDFNIFTPQYIYNNFKVNWFGTLVLFMFFNLLCPLFTIGFWFYKLCTVGRNSEL